MTLLFMAPFSGAMDLATFFTPLHPEIPRSEESYRALPLFLPTEAMSPEQMMELMQGVWQPAYHCNGAPVSLSFLVERAPADGFINSQLFFRFFEDTFFWQMIPANSTKSFGRVGHSGVAEKTIQGRFFLGETGVVNSFRLNYYFQNVQPGLRGGEIRPLYSPDANRWVIDLLDRTLGTCADGSPLRLLLVPVPSM